MSRIFTFSILVFLITFVGMQTAEAQMPKRYATLELFTNTPCGSCINQNPGFFNRLSNFSEDVHQISFYPGRPYPSCPIYQANESGNIAHKDRRGYGYSPQVFINGDESLRSGQMSVAKFEEATGGESFLYVNVEETGTSIVDVAVQLQTFDVSPTTEGRLFVAAVEREYTIAGAPSNWEDEHHNVFRTFLSSVDGDVVDLTNSDQTLNYSYTVDAAWNENEMYILAWVENPDNEFVYNSGTRFDEAFSGTNDLRNIDEVTVYPNPANETISLQLPEDFQLTQIEITDISGRIIGVSNISQQINIVDYAPGIYTLIATGEQGSKVRSTFVKK